MRPTVRLPLHSCQHPPTTGLRSANGRRILATLSNVERNGDYNGDTSESKYPNSKCISDLDAILFHRVGRGKFFLKIRTDRRILYLIRIESVDFMASSLAVNPAILFHLFFFFCWTGLSLDLNVYGKLLFDVCCCFISPTFSAETVTDISLIYPSSVPCTLKTWAIMALSIFLSFVARRVVRLFANFPNFYLAILF